MLLFLQGQDLKVSLLCPTHCFTLKENAKLCLKVACGFTLPETSEFYLLHILPHLGLSVSSFSHSTKDLTVPTVVLTCISLRTHNSENLFMYLFPSVFLLWWNICSNSLPIFKLGYLLFYCCMIGPFHNLDSDSIDTCYWDICSLAIACPFIFFTISFKQQKFLFWWSIIYHLLYVSCILCSI